MDPLAESLQGLGRRMMGETSVSSIMCAALSCSDFVKREFEGSRRRSRTVTLENLKGKGKRVET